MNRFLIFPRGTKKKTPIENEIIEHLLYKIAFRKNYYGPAYWKINPLDYFKEDYDQINRSRKASFKKSYRRS